MSFSLMNVKTDGYQNWPNQISINYLKPKELLEQCWNTRYKIKLETTKLKHHVAKYKQSFTGEE